MYVNMYLQVNITLSDDVIVLLMHNIVSAIINTGKINRIRFRVGLYVYMHTCLRDYHCFYRFGIVMPKSSGSLGPSLS